MPQLPKQVACVDFETYFKKGEYTLRAGKGEHTTTAYVRSPQFKIHGASVRTQRMRKARWFTGVALLRKLHSIDWEHTALLAQNTYFDALILNEYCDIRPSYLLDTMSMGRGLFRDALETRADLNTLADEVLGIGTKHESYLDAVDGVRDPNPKDLALLGEGANIDCDLCWSIFWLMLHEHEFPPGELEVIHHTVRCFTEPVLQVNKPIAERAHRKVVNQRKRLLRRVWKYLNPEGKRFTKDEFAKLQTRLRSRTQFPEMLRVEEVEPPIKVSPTWKNKPREERLEHPEKKYTFAFAQGDIAFRALERHPNSNVADLVKAKLLVNSSIHATRPLRMLEHADPALTIKLGMYNAHTLRWGGGDKMNPQNFSKDSELREAIMAPPGQVLVVVDSKQIEARFLAWLAGQWSLIEQFQDYDAGDNAADPYCVMASIIFGRKITKADTHERFIGKTCVLGMGYQMSAGKYQMQLETGQVGQVVKLETAMYQEIVDAYRGANRSIVELWWAMADRIAKMIQFDYYEEVRGCLTFEQRVIWHPCGLGMHFPRLREARLEELGEEDEERAKLHPHRKQYIYREHTRLYGGKLVENLVQCLCRQIVADQIMRIADLYRVVLLVHDEVVLCVPEAQGPKALADTIDSFSVPPDWCSDLPVGGEGAIVQHYQKL